MILDAVIIGIALALGAYGARPVPEDLEDTDSEFLKIMEKYLRGKEE